MSHEYGTDQVRFTLLGSLRRLTFVVKRYRARLVLSQALLALAAVSALLVINQNRVLFDRAIPRGDAGQVIEVAVRMFLLTVVGAVALLGAGALALFFANATAWGIRTELYRQIQRLSFENFDRMRTGVILVRLGADTSNVFTAILFTVMTALLAPFMVLVAIVLLALQSPQFLPIILGVVVVVVLILAVVVPRMFRQFAIRQRSLDAANSTLQENLAGMPVVKAFTAEQVEVAKYAARTDDLRYAASRVTFLGASISPLLVATASLGTLLILRIGGHQVIDRSGSTIGDISAATSYLSILLTPLAAVALLVPILLRGEESARRILEVYDAEPAIGEPVEPIVLDPEEVRGRVEFSRVTFVYRRPDGEPSPPVLRDLDLVIEAGQRIGILGATGSGKTTLAALIPRFYDVQSGSVSIDGVDVRHLSAVDLRRIVGYTLQDGPLFQGDLAFNLTFGDPGASFATMEEAARTAQAHDFVMHLDGTWNAPVSRRGNNFSGGQRQRLSMTRTLVPRPAVLILDDSTSALDAESEARVQEAIPRFSEGATTIYIAQRISAVIDLDRILLLDGGRLAASGAHHELLETSPLYRDIYVSQLGDSDLPPLRTPVEGGGR